MKRRSRWILFCIGTGTVALLCAVFIFILPNSSATRWYTSPPIDAKGTQIRVKVPAGWKMEFFAQNDIFSISSTSPTKKRFPLPFGLRFPWEANVPHGEIHLIGVSGRAMKNIKPSSSDKLATQVSPPIGGSCFPESFPGEFQAWRADRLVFIKPKICQLTMSYVDCDTTQFQRLQSDIMNSLTVLP